MPILLREMREVHDGPQLFRPAPTIKQEIHKVVGVASAEQPGASMPKIVGRD
jgi:hypothetical protein